ncbi:uncharacterized protein LOC133039888 [Cannabis sativa]|uniref:uncharacterized protein LOC133039888 n=1 Tax=Cannabis sativa TaxID=3483 RepID=UPI0029CA9D43|nr:uncharacterized protein LOC133039888 [Cannabis sativa]
MDVVEAWFVVSSNINKTLTYHLQEIERSTPNLQQEYSSLVKAALRVFESKDLNKFEKQSKFIELIKQAMSLQKRIDEFNDKCSNYNLPLFLGDGEHEDDQSFKNYLRNIQEFMKNWKREAGKKRENGEKSLIESFDESERKNAFEKKIMKNLEDFKNMVKLLSLDNNENNSNSIVIKNLVSVIQLTKTIVKKNKRLVLPKPRKLLSDEGDIEFELLRMILTEVLCVEVVFCGPRMIEVLTDDQFGVYGFYLHKYLRERLIALDLKMNELRVQICLMPSVNEETKKKLTILRKTIDEGYENIWNKLDLNSTSAAASSSSSS